MDSYLFFRENRSIGIFLNHRLVLKKESGLCRFELSFLGALCRLIGPIDLWVALFGRVTINQADLSDVSDTTLISLQQQSFCEKMPERLAIFEGSPIK